MISRPPASVVFHDARVIDPLAGRDAVSDVVLRDGVIVQHPGEMPTDCSHVDCRGLVITPAFIDLHCHLREPGFEEKETIASGTSSAAAGGFGVVCCMPNTRPSLDTAANVRIFGDMLLRQAKIRVYPIAAVTLARKGQSLVDIRSLTASGVVAFSDDGDYVLDNVIMRDALSQAASAGLPVIDHAQDGRLVAGGVLNEGAVARRLKLRGMPAEAEELAVARDIALARLTGGHVHIAHITTAAAVKMVQRARNEGVRVTAEATPHHMLLTDRDAMIVDSSGTARFYNQAKVNPPLRSESDATEVVRGISEGVIDAIATDHAPHTADDKAGTPGEAAFGISGFETALASVLTLCQQGDLSMQRALYCLTAGPARVLGDRIQRPSLEAGLPATMVLFDPESRWTVDPSRFLSRGRNTPLEGKTLQGRVLATFVDGQCVYLSEFLCGVRTCGRLVDIGQNDVSGTGLDVTNAM